MEIIKNILVTIGVLVIIWFAGEAFIELMLDLYHLLDGYIWAFFAGVFAFLITIWISYMMIIISAFFVGLFLAFISMFVD